MFGFGLGTRFRNYVFAKDGRIFCVDTVETFDCGWETMVGEVEDYGEYNRTVQEWIDEGDSEELSTDEIHTILDETSFYWDLFDMTKHYRYEDTAYKGHHKIVTKLTKMVGQPTIFYYSIFVRITYKNIVAFMF